MRAPFGVGDIVVCIRADGTRGRLKLGWKYQVSAVDMGPGFDCSPQTGLAHGIGTIRVFGANHDFMEWWKIARFRPYEPPKPEQSTKSASKPVDAVFSLPSVE